MLSMKFKIMGADAFPMLYLQRLLKEILSSNRLVAPGNAWLMFIPPFNLI